MIEAKLHFLTEMAVEVRTLAFFGGS